MISILDRMIRYLFFRYLIIYSNLLKLILDFLLHGGIGDLLGSGVLARDRDADDVVLVLLVSLEVGHHEVAGVYRLLVPPDSHAAQICLI